MSLVTAETSDIPTVCGHGVVLYQQVILSAARSDEITDT